MLIFSAEEEKKIFFPHAEKLRDELKRGEQNE